MTPICVNCNSPIIPGHQYCGKCGQKTHLHRLTWHDVTHDAIHYFTHADKGIFHLLVQLATRTGNVAKEFVQGKRKKYFPPLNFFLIVAAIYVFVFTLSARPSEPGDFKKEYPELNKIPDLKKRLEITQVYERASKAKVFMSKHSNGVAMLALPILAGIYWIFYRKGGYNYIEHLIANMYMNGFTLLCHVLIFLPLGWLINLKQLNITLIAFFIFQIIYNSIFYYRFLGLHSKFPKWKAFLVSFFGILFWAGLTGTLIRLYISNGFWGFFQ